MAVMVSNDLSGSCKVSLILHLETKSLLAANQRHSQLLPKRLTLFQIHPSINLGLIVTNWWHAFCTFC